MISPTKFGAIYPVTSQDPQKLDAVVDRLKKESAGPVETVEMFAVPQLMQTPQGQNMMGVKFIIPQKDEKLPPSAQRIQLVVTEQDADEHRKKFPLVQAWQEGVTAYQKKLEQKLVTLENALRDKAEVFWQGIVSRGTPATPEEVEEQSKEEKALIQKIEELAASEQVPAMPKSGQEYIKRLVHTLQSFSKQNKSFGLDAKVVEEGLDQGIFDINAGKEDI